MGGYFTIVERHPGYLDEYLGKRRRSGKGGDGLRYGSSLRALRYPQAHKEDSAGSRGMDLDLFLESIIAHQPAAL